MDALKVPVRCYIRPNGAMMSITTKPQGLLEIVRLRHTEECRKKGVIMLLDEEGLLKKNMTINPIGTALYLLNCIPNTWHPIMGTICIAYDEDFQ
jgi:hypothetical protein